MDDREILWKAIQKAQPNASEAWVDGRAGAAVKEVYNYIFSHDFAKDFWGDKLVYSLGWCCWDALGEVKHGDITHYKDCQNYGAMALYYWEYHLQNMVIADDPIAYLAKFLDGEKNA